MARSDGQVFEAQVRENKVKFIRHRQKSMRKFTTWIKPNMKKYLLSCCDCNLVHELQFKIEGTKVLYRAKRAIKHTKQRRKEQDAG